VYVFVSRFTKLNAFPPRRVPYGGGLSPGEALLSLMPPFFQFWSLLYTLHTTTAHMLAPPHGSSVRAEKM